MDEAPDEIAVPPSPIDDSPSAESDPERAEYRTLANGFLSPRHRKLAELFAGGASSAKVAEALGLTSGRVSVLKNNPLVAAEIARISERIYEDTIANRLKALADPALTVIETALTDRTNRFKKSEQLDAAKWVVEKLDGKAAQKIDLGGGMLSSLLDKLDALKSAGRSVDAIIDVTPLAELPPGQTKEPPAPVSDELRDWIEHF